MAVGAGVGIPAGKPLFNTNDPPLAEPASACPTPPVKEKSPPLTAPPASGVFQLRSEPPPTWAMAAEATTMASSVAETSAIVKRLLNGNRFKLGLVLAPTVSAILGAKRRLQ